MGRSRALSWFLCGFLWICAGAVAQGPGAKWEILETEHFRLHYPVESEGWTRRAAARLEGVWAGVEKEVGYRPPERIDVLISDPVADANGEALPFLGWPRMVLWTSPPEPESVIGHYSDWSELLLVHEGTHLAHLLRPSRNPWERTLSRLIPIGPVVRQAPRWVDEGYATVVEGRLTGSGRPNGDLRAAILRRRAAQGKLPSYGALNGDRSWHGGSMAYLMGSAFLEWLDQRAGGGSLPKLWARLTARESRSFRDAFRGIYGESPEDLYGRFTAELTWQAVEVERRLKSAAREGELWQDLSWETGAPAVSADGKLLALVLRQRDEPSRLVVWSTVPDSEAEQKWRKRRDEIASRDPEDVPAVRSRPLPQKALHTLPAIDGIAPTTPRFYRDGQAILFVRYEPDGEGFLHPDLFRWELESGRIARLTREADLREPDPSPDGRSALAIRNRNGNSQVVRVDLLTGAVQAVTEPSLEIVYDHPRWSPDGRRAVYARHTGGVWKLTVRDLENGAEADLAAPPEATVASPAWSGDGTTIYAVVGHGGLLDIWAFPVAPVAPPYPVIQTAGAALAPAPTPDGKALFYLGLESDGLDLRRLELGPPPSQDTLAALPALPATAAAELAPALRPPASPPVAPFPIAEVGTGREEGGRQELLPLVAGSVTSSSATAELGVRAGDLVGRFDGLALGAIGGRGGPEGGALAGVWRGWPVALSLHLFDVRELPSQEGGHAGVALPDRRALDLSQRGLELRAQWDRELGPARVRLAGGGLWSQVDPRAAASTHRTLEFLAARYQAVHSRGSWYLEDAVRLDGESGETAGDPFHRYGGAGTLGFGHDDSGLRLSYRRSRAGGTLAPYDLLAVGGLDGSLLPESARSERIAVPALPAGTLLGRDYEGERAELRLGFLPAPLFFERHRMDSGDWLRLAGIEWRFALAPQPLLRLPALDLRLGAARVLDPPLRGETRGWLLTVLHP